MTYLTERFLSIYTAKHEAFSNSTIIFSTH